MPIVVYRMTCAEYQYMINARSNETAEIKFKNGWECRDWLLSKGITKVLFCELEWPWSMNGYAVTKMEVVDVM